MKNIKIALCAASALLFVGCTQKSEISYFMPQLKTGTQTNSRTTVKSYGSSSYLASDKIWYKKDSLFLPYKNSFLAKTPREHLVQSIEAIGVDASLSLNLVDAYQLYDGGKSSFVLTVFVDGGKNGHKLYAVKKDGLGMGAPEAVRGFELAVDELCERIKIDFGGNK